MRCKGKLKIMMEGKNKTDTSEESDRSKNIILNPVTLKIKNKVISDQVR